MTVITTLLNTPDGHEIVRKRIADVIWEELEGQKVLAQAQGEDPLAFAADVFEEQHNPFDRFNESRVTLPAINVWFDSSSYERQGSTVRAQRADGNFNIDIYCNAVSEEDAPGGSGHLPGDVKAATEASRWAGIIRRILMSAHYVILGSPYGANQFCFGRWIDSVNAFQPQIETRPAIHIHAIRLVLGVHFKVDSPQWEGQPMEIATATVKRAVDGKVIAEVTNTYP